MTIGVDNWVGEGGYSGPVYHDLIAGSDANVDTLGWIIESP